MNEFYRKRRIGEPRADTPVNQMLGFVGHGERLGQYENETTLLYEERFKPSVDALGRALRDRLGYDIDDLDRFELDAIQTLQQVKDKVDRLNRLVDLLPAPLEVEHAGTVDSEGQVVLTIRRRDGRVFPDGAGCIVIRLVDGREMRALPERLRTGGETLTLRYPTEFRDAPDHPERGEHEAVWVQVGLTEGRGDAVTSELARDRFEVKAGGLIE